MTTHPRRSRTNRRGPYELVFVGGLPASVQDDLDSPYIRNHATFEAAKEEADRILHERQDLNWNTAHPAIIYGPGCGRDGVTIA